MPQKAYDETSGCSLPCICHL